MVFFLQNAYSWGMTVASHVAPGQAYEKACALSHVYETNIKICEQQTRMLGMLGVLTTCLIA